MCLGRIQLGPVHSDTKAGRLWRSRWDALEATTCDYTLPHFAAETRCLQSCLRTITSAIELILLSLICVICPAFIPPLMSLCFMALLSHPSPSLAACCLPRLSSHPFITGPCSVNPRGFCLFVLELLLQLATDPTYFLTSHLNSRAALQLLYQLA